MPLVELSLPIEEDPLPAEARKFIRAADERAEAILADGRLHAFVPSNFRGAYHALKAAIDFARGPVFCEWGCGLGTVAGLASLIGFESYGIEADGELVDRARGLAEEFGLDTVIAHGSFVPPGAEPRVHAAGNYAWLTTEADYAYEELGLEPADLDVVYAYPWPDEEAVTADLFARYAGPGALLVTFHGGDGFRLRRKVRRRGRS